MRDFKQCVEREEIIFNVEVKDPTAPVDFFINGEPVDTSDGRVEVKNLGEGKHQLILHKVMFKRSWIFVTNHELSGQDGGHG